MTTLQQEVDKVQSIDDSIMDNDYVRYMYHI